VEVVTARYRPENAQEVPISITTLSNQQLQALGGTRSLTQIIGQLPSVNIQGFSGRNQTITIRGLGTNAGGTNDGLEQGVGLYIDGVYRPRTGTAITDLLDIETVQVLKGPQGTLFGKNTVAGAIDLRTAEPGFKRQVKAEFSYGKYNYARAYVSLTNPISDTLTFRVSYLRTSRQGLIYNTTFSEPWDNLNNDAIRADILWKPNDTFKNRLIADYSMQACDCGFYSVRQALPTTLANGKEVRGFYDKAADVNYKPIAIDPFARKVDIDSSQSDRMPSWGVQNTATLRLGEHTLTSISAYRNWKWLPHYDGDQMGANVSTNSVVETHQQQFSQEVRLASPGGQTLDYTAGLYFWYQQANDNQYSAYGRHGSQWLVSPTTSPDVLNGLVAYSHVVPATTSYAAYGQATWNPTKRWHFTGGLRATLEHKSGSYDAYPQGNVVPVESFPADQQAAVAATRASFAPTGAYSKQHNVSNPSWTAIIARDVTDDIHVFATYSRGYKSPGINLVRQTLGVDVFVKPEKVDDFEFAAKTEFFGGRLQVNPTLFYIIDSNYQANYVNTSVTPTASYITNVGTLISKGAELDLRVFPVRGLFGSASFAYNDAKYDSYTNAPAQFLYSYLGTQDLSGQQASGAPKWTMGALAEYGFPIIKTKGDPIDGYLGGDWSFRSSYKAAVNLDPYSNIPAYQLWGAHVGVRNNTRWDLSFWVRNLTDKRYYNTASVSSQYGLVYAALGEPRTFGGTVRATF
jgi:iron complex outermembrane receptor protein